MMRAESSAILLVTFVFFSNSISFIEGTSHRLHRYKELHESHKCHFPRSTSKFSLFGHAGYLSGCDRIVDPVGEPKKYNLTEQLCQSLIDELLIYCHADLMPSLNQSEILNNTVFNNFMTSTTVDTLCGDDVVAKYREASAWKMLGSPMLCKKVCHEYLPLCRLQVFVWKLADVASGLPFHSHDSLSTTTTTTTANVSQNETNGTTAALTTAKPEIPASTTPMKKKHVIHHSKGEDDTKKKFRHTMENVMKEKTQDIPSGGHHAQGAKKHGPAAGVHPDTRSSIGIGGKLFIFFGIFSIVLIVGAYVAYYKRDEIRAFCCEDPNDVRYRRIREDRAQQAAQPLKNMAF